MTQEKMSIPKPREQYKVYQKFKSSQWSFWSLLTFTPWECSILLCTNSYLPSGLCSMYLVWMLARESIITRELRRVYSRVLEAISLFIKCLSYIFFYSSFLWSVCACRVCMCVSVFVVGVCVFHGYTCVCFHEHLCECGYWMLILDVFLYNSLCYVLRQVLWLHAKLNSSSNLDNQCIPKGSMPTFGEL